MTSHRLVRGLSALTAMAAVAVAAWAVDSVEVTGVVHDTGGDPLPGVEVALVEQWERGDELREEVVTTVETDGEGRYAVTVPNVQLQYVLRLSHAGEVAFETELTVRRNQEPRLDFVIPTEEERDSLPPEAVEAYNNGVNAARAGRAGQAVGQFRQAVELAPESAAAHLALAELLLHQGNAAEAATLADTAVELAPDSQRALKARFETYAALEEPEKAAEARAAYEAVVPGAVNERLLEEAQAAYNKGKLERAEERLTKLLERQPENPQAHYLFGLCRIYQGDAAGARPYLERFLELAPDSPDAATARDLLAGLSSPP